MHYYMNYVKYVTYFYLVLIYWVFLLLIGEYCFCLFNKNK